MRHIFSFVLLMLLMASCGSSNSERPSVQYENKKESLADMERGNPLKFLKVNGDSHTNLVNKAVIEGSISNSATIAAYKDVELRIVFKDKSGSVIERNTKVINDVVQPNSSSDFKIKMNKPKGTVSVTLDIVGAVAEK